MKDSLLLQKQKYFASIISDFIVCLEVTHGFEVTLGEAWRSPETCALYATEGKGIKNSNHQNRLAMDLNLFKDGELLTAYTDYWKAGDVWKRIPGPYKHVWGGDFKMIDVYHFAIEHDGVQ